ncbi:MAG TPA: hypothetical protein DEO26_02300 [Candidatus Veblenbacteria bacterium]|nr:hypothetical protein [Candidatus Veblenbacteria bacterium]
MPKIVLVIFSLSLIPLTVTAEEVRPIVFPVEGEVSFSDSYGDSRSGGRVHEGVDIFAPKMRPLIATVDGRITMLPQNEPYYGYAIFMRGDDDYQYRYIHVNNDTPGTDDGQGGVVYAYAPTITDNARVVAGQLLVWVGDSGNAENVGSHLHFEIHTPDGTPINPYLSLVNASHPGAFDPEITKQTAPTINDDKQLLSISSPACQSNTLVKASTDAVYYCGADGQRYVFPNQKIYLSWYTNFSGVITITDAELANVPLGGNVTYRPGVRMVKMTTDPKVYAVAAGGILRHVTSPELARSIYGEDWNTLVDDLSDAFFVNYHLGDPITTIF